MSCEMNRQAMPVSFRMSCIRSVEHLRLDRHVERRDALVGDDDPGRERQRPVNADALARATREFVRTRLNRYSTRSVRADGKAMTLQGFGHEFADAHARIERDERILGVDGGTRAGVPTEMAQRFKAPERENRVAPAPESRPGYSIPAAGASSSPASSGVTSRTAACIFTSALPGRQSVMQGSPLSA